MHLKGLLVFTVGFPRFRTLMKRKVLSVCGGVLAFSSSSWAVDQNSNQQSDVWEMLFNSAGLAATGDFDGDGWSNAAESAAGTHPKDSSSFPWSEIELTGSTPFLSWQSAAGKRYTLLASGDLGSFSATGDVAEGSGAEMSFELPPADGSEFFRIAISDVDTDGDGLNNWEEASLGFNPLSSRTDRYEQTDSQRVTANLNAASTVTASLYDASCSELWPDPAVLVLRRSGGLKPLSVNFTLGGSALRDTDYQTNFPGNVATFKAGQREVFLEISGLADDVNPEADETVILTINAGTGYTVGATASATATVVNETAANPSAKAAARFLVQAAFGPDQDAADDADIIPENVETVMTQGFETWLTNQFDIPPQYHEPFVQMASTIPEMHHDPKMVSWWNRALGTQAIYPGGPPAQYDPVRQRVAYSLSQIFVVSDRPETLAVEFRGMANYYDMLVRNSLGNYRDLLFDVATHPVMGFYLSHVKNKKGNPATNTFPDENFAREVMQLFSIGLWELNPDGTRKVDEVTGKHIPTYTNVDITNFARVFTGLSYGPISETNFEVYHNPPKWLIPMRGHDFQHDLAPKTLLRGATTPARTASSPDVGTATMLDVNAAIDNLFNHPNVGPFIGRQLIQRLVTSNPSPAYIGRVSAAFADNGSGVRGDMKAVIRAILLDPEARDGAKLADPHWGKPREPFLRCVNYGRAFNAKSSGVDFYQVSQFNFDQQQQPYNSPSVFNFYLPNYLPPGEVGDAGLVAPEFQILNATTAVSSPNYFYNSIQGRDLHRWGTADSTRTVRPNFTQEAALATTDVDALIRRLDLHLTCGNLSPQEFQSISEAVRRLTSGNPWNWDVERLNLAVYLILTSPEFCILR
ncbi:MAG: DUF1800 family protein [Verrucomicrobiaceae bacterium]|nr:MAG: DUF1800 family protein [Verrucomicrobiaceae bacterium]